MDVTRRYHSLETQIYPWFEPQWQRVQRLFSTDKLPHALIVNGVQGIGKLHFASSVAQFVLCQKSVHGSACLECRSCKLFSSSGHPDLYHLCPEDEGGQIKVDQVRDLSEFMHSTAQQGGYRVVILEPAEAMNISAANALLKTLEEPGDKSLLLLLSHQMGQVMPTIKSRCQRVDCPVPDEAMASQWLAEKLQLENAKALQLLKVVHGSPLAALSFKQRGEQALRSEFLLGLKSLLQRKNSAITLAPVYAKKDIIMLLSWLYSLLVDISRLSVAGSDISIVNQDMAKMLATLAKRANIKQVYALSDKVQGHRRAIMAHQNPNRQLLLEDLLIDWKNLI